MSVHLFVDKVILGNARCNNKDVTYNIKKFLVRWRLCTLNNLMLVVKYSTRKQTQRQTGGVTSWYGKCTEW